MAISASAVWEVRPTVGSDTNGGGFVAGASGTDYSQQNSPNSGGNNGSTTDVVATGVATITSASASFTAAIVGNIIYLAGSGITTGWYQVVTYTNGTTVILDRSPGTGVGVTMNVGGALATVSQGYANAAFVTTGTFTAPVYVKATGTYTVTSAFAPSNANESPIAIIGYTTTRGDNGQFTWTTSTNSTPLVNVNGAANVVFQNINFTTTAGTVSDCITNNNVNIYGIACINCAMAGFRYGINGNYNLEGAFTGLTLDSCLITGCTIGVNNSGSTFILASLIYGNSGHGFYCTAPHTFGIYLERSVFYDNGGSGAFIDNGSQYVAIINCGFDANTSDGLTVTGQSPGMPISVWNTIFTGNGGYGFNVTGQGYGAGSIRSNAYYNNTSGATSRTQLTNTSDVTLTGSPFTNPSGLDFTLNSTAGAGAACKAAGYPASLP